MKRIVDAKAILMGLLFVGIALNAWGKSVTLSWDASPSTVTGYRIYYDINSSATPLDGGTPIDAGNVLTYTVTGLSDNDDHYFAVTAYDDSDTESTYSNIVHSPPVAAENSPPVLSAVGNKAVLEGAVLSIDLAATDADGDTLTFSATGLPSGASLDSASGEFSWTPGSSQSGQYDVTFSVSDGQESDSETIQITVTDVAVNQAPVLASIGNKAINEGDTQNILISATDPDGDNLTYSVTDLPQGASFNSETHMFSWPTTYDQAGSYNVTFNVSDGSLSDSEQITITVVETNRAPTLTSIGTKNIGEGEQLSFTISGSDPDDDALTYRAENLPEDADFEPSTRSFTWIPDYNESENIRVYTVTFVVSDGVLEASELVTINVTNVNRAPVLTPVGPQSFTEGDSVNLVMSATDPDNNALTYSASGLPDGSVFTEATRSFSWIPDQDQAGNYTVTFSVSDGDLSDSEDVSIVIGNGNEAPVFAEIGPRSVAEGELLEFVLTATDSNGDSLTYAASGLPEGATFSSAEKRFSWTPEYSQAGSFTVEFRVSDGQLEDVEAVAISVSNTNRPPVISGSPEASVMATAVYSFAPVASDPDGDSLTFTADNVPAWASVDGSTGALSGTPGESQTGVYDDISLIVSDGSTTATLGPFSVTVTAYVPLDSDGDGVYDHLDAFPNDPNESVDTDGDLIGNNSDSDDDNDGVADIRDGFPLDSQRQGWVISASAGSGGYITPDGDSSVLFGSSQSYVLTPMDGYYVNDLLVDGVSAGLVGNYEFADVAQHHTIEAVFAPIPVGLSYDPLSSGLAGVERVDGGDDRNNFVDGEPKQDIDYQFEVTLKDTVPATERTVYLILNSYKYAMSLTDGALASGAEYTFKTRLGPAFAHRFYFEAEDASGQVQWRYPASGELDGPVVELMNGRNVIGLAADVNAFALDSNEAFDMKTVYRWQADSGPNGSFKLVDAGAPVASGEGFVLKKASGGTLLECCVYGDIQTDVYEIEVKGGWNLISNPYGGNVNLADIQVKRGDDAPLDWLDAEDSLLVVDVIYSYLGEEWGGVNEYSSAAGEQPAVLTPWIGYWIYVNPNDQPVSLLIPKPLQ